MAIQQKVPKNQKMCVRAQITILDAIVTAAVRFGSKTWTFR